MRMALSWLILMLVVGCAPERMIAMASPIPAVSAQERGTIAFTMDRLNASVLVAGGGWFVARQNADSTNFTKLTTSPHSAYYFDWSPDGSRIAYNLQIYGNLPGFMTTPPDNTVDLLKATHELYSNLAENLQSMSQIQIMPQL